MYNSLRWQFEVIIIISVLNVHVIAQVMTDEGSGPVSEDFANFLRGLGSMVYRRSTRPTHTSMSTSQFYETTTKLYRTKTTENIMNTQKAALRDALMLKLVSYYEDKYSLSHHDPFTKRTPRAEVRKPSLKKVHRLNMEIVQKPKMRPTIKFHNLHLKYPVEDVVVI